MATETQPHSDVARTASAPSALVVLIGTAPALASPSSAVLLVDTHASQLQELRRKLGPNIEESASVFQQGLLTATPGEEVHWFRFNDSRLDGVVPLETWRTFYPNLQLIGEESFSSLTLADLLNDWPAAQDQQRSIQLTLGQGNPLQVLEGAGNWLERIERIELQGHRFAELWQDSCDRWLLGHGFRSLPQDPLVWTVDPMALRLRQCQAELQSLRDQQQAQQQEQATQRERLLAAVKHLFPYAIYRQMRPDLVDFDDQALVNHFIIHGLREKVVLKPSALHGELERLRKARATEPALLAILKEKSQRTAEQLDILKHLLAQQEEQP